MGTHDGPDNAVSLLGGIVGGGLEAVEPKVRFGSVDGVPGGGA